MADDVKWIRFKVGTFDGMSFKRIKKAKIDGIVNLRDKLTAVWFELLDLSGKVNNQGFLVNDELAFRSFEDIAIVLDRTPEEIETCIKWFVNEKMMEITNDIFMISNWSKYQNIDGLEKIQLQNRERQRKFRETKRNNLLLLTENTNCVYCGQEAKTIDHIIPQSKGGKDEPNNVVKCCLSCNQKKTNKDLVQFLNEEIIVYKNTDIINKVLTNDVLNKHVMYDYNKQKFVTLHVTLGNGVSLIDNNSSSSSQSILLSLDLEVKDNKPSIDDMFEDFWNNYPKKVSKKTARKWFDTNKKKVTKELIDTMVLAIQKQKTSNEWKKNKGQFIPNPTTWLNQEKWNDQLTYESEDKYKALKEFMGND